MANIANLAINLTARTSAFERRMRKSQSTIKRFSGGVLRVGRLLAKFSTIAAVAGIGVLTLSLKKFISAASDAQEIAGKFDVVFGDLAGEANKWAADFGKAVGRSNQETKKWLASLQDLFVPLGFTRKEGLKLSSQLTKLAVDVASFNNAVDDDVLRDFKSALVGNHETVRKYGIIISETTLKAEAMRQGLLKNKKVLTDLEKVNLRLNMIIKGTVDAQGDAIRTGDSYANQIKRLQSNILNLQETLGKKLLPVFTDVVAKLNEFLQDEANINKITTAFKNMALAVASVADAMVILKAASKNSLTAAKVGAIKAGIKIFQLQKKVLELQEVTINSGIGRHTVSKKNLEFYDELSQKISSMNGQIKEFYEGAISVTSDYRGELQKLFDTMDKAGKNKNPFPWLKDWFKDAGKGAIEGVQAAAEKVKEIIRPGEARQIRSTFVSVSGLAFNPMLQTAKESLNIQKDQLQTLEEIKRQGGQSYL